MIFYAREDRTGAARACAHFYCGPPRSWTSQTRMCQVQRSAPIPPVILTDSPGTEMRAMQPKSEVMESKLEPADHLAASGTGRRYRAEISASEPFQNDSGIAP
jgi:hypothetical protein